MDNPFFILEFDDGSVFEILDDKYEMSFDESYIVNCMEIFFNKNEKYPINDLKIGKNLKILSYDFGVERAVILNISNFDKDLVEKFGMTDPLYLISIEFRSQMMVGDEYTNYKKLYNRKRNLGKILK